MRQAEIAMEGYRSPKVINSAPQKLNIRNCEKNKQKKQINIYLAE